MSFLLRGRLVGAVLLFMVAFFAAGRLGMLTSVLLLTLRLFVADNSSKSKKLVFVFGVVCILGLLLISLDENRLTFISSALNLDSDQNISRTDFWLQSIDYFLTYHPSDFIVGRFGSILMAQGGTENDFLRLLLDCGLLGFLIYIIPIIALFIRGIRLKNLEDFVVAIMIFLLMNIFPFIQSLSSSLLFWVYFFVTFNRSKQQSITPRLSPVY